MGKNIYLYGEKRRKQNKLTSPAHSLQKKGSIYQLCSKDETLVTLPLCPYVEL